MTHTSAGLKLYGYQLSTFDNQLKVAYSQIVFHFALNLPKKGAKSLFWVFSLYTCIVRTIVLGTFLGDLSQNKNKLSEFKPSLWNLFTRNSINWNRYASKHLRAAAAATSLTRHSMLILSAQTSFLHLVHAYLFREKLEIHIVLHQLASAPAEPTCQFFSRVFL